MPVIAPTPAEFAAMSWHAQNKTRAELIRLLRAYGMPNLPVTHAERAKRNRQRHAAWAHEVRKEARRLERESNRRAVVQR